MRMKSSFEKLPPYCAVIKPSSWNAQFGAIDQINTSLQEVFAFRHKWPTLEMRFDTFLESFQDRQSHICLVFRVAAMLQDVALMVLFMERSCQPDRPNKVAECRSDEQKA